MSLQQMAEQAWLEMATRLREAGGDPDNGHREFFIAGFEAGAAAMPPVVRLVGTDWEAIGPARRTR